jgi:hypothetical protein
MFSRGSRGSSTGISPALQECNLSRSDLNPSPIEDVIEWDFRAFATRFAAGDHAA